MGADVVPFGSNRRGCAAPTRSASRGDGFVMRLRICSAGFSGPGAKLQTCAIAYFSFLFLFF